MAPEHAVAVADVASVGQNVGSRNQDGKGCCTDLIWQSLHQGCGDGTQTTVVGALLVEGKEPKHVPSRAFRHFCGVVVGISHKQIGFWPGMHAALSDGSKLAQHSLPVVLQTFQKGEESRIVKLGMSRTVLVDELLHSIRPTQKPFVLEKSKR